ncbi:hypothetical protein BH09PAT3_BH09PAT3_1660 [soil metagenome]
MDFTGRGSQPAQPANTGTQFSGGTPSAGNNVKKTSKNNKQRNLVRWGGGVLGLLVVALVVAVIVTIGFGGQKSESQYVDKNKLQAVFLQTGQVYFGNVTTLNKDYFVVSNIYYLQTSSTGTDAAAANSNTSVSLVKLGCELHAPYDQMVINRDQVTFWENLQDDGQVAKAVTTFKKDNPDGQKCADQSAANSATGVQGTDTTTGTGTTTTTPKTSN